MNTPHLSKLILASLLLLAGCGQKKVCIMEDKQTKQRHCLASESCGYSDHVYQHVSTHTYGADDDYGPPGSSRCGALGFPQAGGSGTFNAEG